jgi:type II secretory pathway pseudopilin PulG
VTLVELLVVLVILGITITLSSVALGKSEVARSADVSSQLLALRRDAIRTGRPETRSLLDSAGAHVVTVLPDGRVLAEPMFRVEPAAGALPRSTR